MTHTATQRVFQALMADSELNLMQATYGSDGSVRLAVFELAGDYVLVAVHKVPGVFENSSEPGEDDDYREADDLDDNKGWQEWL